MNYGYIQDEIKPEDYTLGSLSPKVINPSGQWTLYLPEKEVQAKRGVESMNCTQYGTYNAFEIIMWYRYGIKCNFSERYGGNMAGTTRDGNSPQKAIEVTRKYAGVIPESDLPFDDSVKTWDDYYSGVTFAHKIKGISWLKEWEITHEWVLHGEHDDWVFRLKDALKRSPVGIAVQAWHLKDGLFVRSGSDTHWCTLVGFHDREYWVVFDSYDNNIKKLAWDYKFTRAKNYFIDKRVGYDAKFVTRAIQGMIGIY